MKLRKIKMIINSLKVLLVPKFIKVAKFLFKKSGTYLLLFAFCLGLSINHFGYNSLSNSLHAIMTFFFILFCIKLVLWGL